MNKILAAMSFLLVLGVSTAATAKSVTPHFDKMEGELHGGQLVLVYEVTATSWELLKAHGIKPMLNLYRTKRGKDKFLDTQKLNSRKGSFTFSKKKAPLAEGAGVKIRIHGSGGKHKIAGWRLGERQGKELGFRISNGKLVSAGGESVSQEPAEPVESKPQAPAGWRAAVVEACDEFAYVSSQKGECVGLAVKIDPRWAAETVEACNRYGYVNSQINECIEIAGDHKKFNPADTAKACDDNTYVNSEFLDCMRATADYKAPPKTMLKACSDAVYVNSQKMECFEIAADLKKSDASLLRACEGRDWKKCVKNATQ